MALPIGEVTIVHGTATAAAGDVVRPLHVSDPVFEDDLIATKGDSAVEIRFADDTILAQGANSELLLDEYTYDPSSGNGKLAFDMIQGTFRSVTGAIVDHNPENFELGSPLATIGIRGTTTAHTIPPAWAADATEAHVVLVYDGKPVLVITTAEGDIRLIDSSGRKVEVSDLGSSPVIVMTVAEYIYYEQLATEHLSGQEPAFDSPEDIIQDNPGTNRPVGGHPEGNLGDYNPSDLHKGDHNLGDLDGDGDVDQDDLDAANEEIVETIESLVLIGNGMDNQMQSSSYLLGGNQLLLQGSSSALQMLQSMLYQSSGFGQQATTLISTVAQTVAAAASVPTVNFTFVGGNTELTAAQLSTGFVAAAPAGAGPFVVALPGGAVPPAGTSVTADFSSFGTNQGVTFNASAIVTGGYFTATGGAGVDNIFGTDHNTDGDTINGGDGNDVLKGFHGDDTINGGDGNDTIYGFTDTVSTGTGSDNDTLNGDVGDDYLDGGIGDDTITGGTGADEMHGGDGDDIFVYTGTGDVDGGESIAGDTGTDTIRVDGNTDFTILDSVDVTGVEQLHITAGVSATFAHTFWSVIDTLSKISGSATANTVESLIFNFATVGGSFNNTLFLDPTEFDNWNAGEDIIRVNGTTGNETFTGTSLNEVWYGGAGSDTFNPGEGNDTLYGEAGSDIFDFTANINNYTDQDVINGGDHLDTLKINASDDPTYTLANVTQVESVEISSTVNGARFVLAGSLNGYEGVANYNASAMGASSSLHLDTSAESNGTEVTAGTGANTIITGSGNDTLDFTATSFDTTDSVNGNGGVDTLKVDSQYEQNISATNVSNIEQIEFYGGTSNINWTLPAGFATSALTIDYSAITQIGLANVLHAENATGNLTIICQNTTAQSNIYFGTGADNATGSAGTDTFSFGTHYTDADTVNGNADTADKITFTSDGSTTYSLANISNVEVIELGAATTNIALTGDLISSGSPTVWIKGNGLGSNVLTVNGSANTVGLRVTGADGADTFTVGGGVETFEGGAGNDTMIFNNVTVNSQTSFTGGSGTDTVHIQGTVDFQNNAIGNNFSSGIERFVFTDGASASFNFNAPGQLTNYDSITGGSGSTTETLNIVTDTNGTDFSGFAPNLASWGSEDVIKYTGTSGANAITGSNDNLNETMYGVGGNDVFTLKGGNDHLYGGADNDTFDFSGNASYFTNDDHVDGGSETDTLQFISDGTTTYTFEHVTGVEYITLGNAPTTIVMHGSLGCSDPTPTFDASAIAGAFSFDGSNETTGLTLELGSGTNSITGSSGSDVFDFSSTSFGVADSVDGGAGSDELKITFAANTTALNAVRNIETFSFSNPSSFSWTLNDDVVDDNATVTFDIAMDNGTETSYFNASAELHGSVIVNALSNDDVIYGGQGNDTLTGGNIVYGNGGNDIISNAKTVDGGAGNDTITSGVGGHTITTGTGSDIVRYTATNQGGDTLNDFATGTDTLQFDAGVFSNTAQLVHDNFGGTYSYNPATTDAYFVFDEDSGKLWYDPDGSTATATEILMATLHDGSNPLALDMTGTIAGGDVDITVV